MQTNQFGRRGMLLESVINKSIIYYRDAQIALIHKQHLPISVIKVSDDQTRLLEKARIKTKALVDYYGVYRGQFIAFEAKSTHSKALPLQNIKAHQLQYLKQVTAHGGKAFFIVYFALAHEFFYIPLAILENLTQKQLSLAIAKQKGLLLPLNFPGYLDFLKVID